MIVMFAKLAFPFLSRKPFHVFNTFSLFPSFRFSSFISLGKRGIKEIRRCACAPPVIISLY